MGLNSIQESFEMAAKRQKLSSSKSQELIVQVGYEIEQALERIQSGSGSTLSVDQKTVLTDLKAKLQVVNSHTHLEGPQQELNIYLNRCQKSLEKELHPDISQACVNVDFDRNILNQIVICHLNSEGLFDIVDCLIKETGDPETISLRLQYQEIHQILEALKSKNLEPAFEWVLANLERLKESGSDLELKLHKLRYMEFLQNQGREDALRYARTYLAPLASRHMAEVQRLICCILWEGRLDKSPYADLVDPVHWKGLAEELMRTFRIFTGQSSRDHLKVAVAAGMEGLPTLLKLRKVMGAKKQEWDAMKQLPVSIELGNEFMFHSIFVCPVSRDQGNDENPPMLLPCGHVVCKQSINNLSKDNSRNFKCPYCPKGASVSQCRQIWL